MTSEFGACSVKVGSRMPGFACPTCLVRDCVKLYLREGAVGLALNPGTGIAVPRSDSLPD